MKIEQESSGLLQCADDRLHDKTDSSMNGTRILARSPIGALVESDFGMKIRSLISLLIVCLTICFMNRAQRLSNRAKSCVELVFWPIWRSILLSLLVVWNPAMSSRLNLAPGWSGSVRTL